MADGTKISWSEATWNIITGCTVVSRGCTNCYAQKLAGTRLAHHPSRAGLTRDTKAGPVWTGEVRFNEQWLDQPLRWAKPRMIFVAAHGDLFHESVPDAWLDRVFAVMALAPQHTFQVLTKRPDRMRAYMTSEFRSASIRGAACALSPGVKVPYPSWPLPNVWIGTSVEDQKSADERLPILRQIPAAVRWISAEPLLEEITIAPHLEAGMWVVVGCESGQRRRRFDNTWALNLMWESDQGGAFFFVKQVVDDDGRVLKDIATFPPELRLQEFPR